jgi:hypothetical protein
MFIVPFIYKKTIIQQLCITIFKILTVGGKQLWVENDSFDINDILTPNEIYTDKSPQKFGNIMLCSVDINKTNINDFYKWEDISLQDNDTFCWRTFYTFGEKENYTSWLPVPTNEYSSDYNYKELLDIIHQYNS